MHANFLLYQQPNAWFQYLGFQKSSEKKKKNEIRWWWLVAILWCTKEQDRKIILTFLSSCSLWDWRSRLFFSASALAYAWKHVIITKSHKLYDIEIDLHKNKFKKNSTRSHTARSWVRWCLSSLALRLSSVSPSTSWNTPLDEGAAFKRKRLISE